MSLLQIAKKKRPASPQSEAFAEKFGKTAQTPTAEKSTTAEALTKKLGTDQKPIEAAAKPAVRIEAPISEEPAKVETNQPETAAPSQTVSPAPSMPTHPAYKGERERITGRFKADLVARLDAIGLLEIEDRNTIIERVLEAWVEVEWQRLQTVKGKADLEFAYGRARAALEKKRGR